MRDAFLEVELTADVPKLLQVRDGVILRVLHAQARVPALPTVLRGLVAALHVLRQRERRLGDRVSSLQQVSGDAMSGDSDEAEPLEALTQRSDEQRTAIGVDKIREIHHRNPVQHQRLLFGRAHI